MRARALATLLVLVGAACGGDRSASGGDSPSDSAGAGAVAGAPGSGATTIAGTTSGAAGASAPGGVALDDAAIVYAVDGVHAADSAGGELAARKATDAAVRSYGVMMTTDHHRLRAELQRLADTLRITPHPPAGDRREAQAKEAMDTLQRKPRGADWDRSYIAHEVAAHQAALELAAQALNSTRRAELHTYLTKASPVIRAHLARALAIQQTLAARP